MSYKAYQVTIERTPTSGFIKTIMADSVQQALTLAFSLEDKERKVYMSDGNAKYPKLVHVRDDTGKTVWVLF